MDAWRGHRVHRVPYARSMTKASLKIPFPFRALTQRNGDNAGYFLHLIAVGTKGEQPNYERCLNGLRNCFYVSIRLIVTFRTDR